MTTTVKPPSRLTSVHAAEFVTREIQVRTCREEDRERWEEFVSNHSECTSYHRWSWKNVFQEVFQWPAHYLIAEESGKVRGILPLIRQKCLLRTYLSSMPHLNGGGIVADAPEIEKLLFASAVDAAREMKAAYLEMRHLTWHDLPLEPRNDKVGAILPIEGDEEGRFRRLDKKTRNLVRKSLTFGLTAHFGRTDLLDDFYSIYQRNMRDLGSPSYARSFFAEILAQFPDDASICVVRLGGEPVAAGFLIGFRETVEVAWASSNRKFLHLKPNMFLYWNILAFAAQQKYEFLDFGRSGQGSGTYEFKMRWGAVPSQLHWGYWHREQTKVAGSRSEGMQLAREIWRRLPIGLTKALGPSLIRHIPGV